MIVQIVLAGLVTAMLSILVRQYRPEHAMGISIVFGIAVFALAAVKFTAIFQDLYQLLQTAGIRQDYFSMLIKAVGIAYLAEFATQLCKDAGEGAVAQKIGLGARVVLLGMAVPVLVSVVQQLLAVLQVS